jgi:hypothetical protein
MRKLVLMAVLVPLLALGANICVWNYDPVDRFYDPAVGDSINCAYHVAQTLINQGHNVQVFDTSLPANLSGYDLVFCLMGWYRC